MVTSVPGQVNMAACLKAIFAVMLISSKSCCQLQVNGCASSTGNGFGEDYSEVL